MKRFLNLVFIGGIIISSVAFADMEKNFYIYVMAMYLSSMSAILLCIMNKQDGKELIKDELFRATESVITSIAPVILLGQDILTEQIIEPAIINMLIILSIYSIYWVSKKAFWKLFERVGIWAILTYYIVPFSISTILVMLRWNILIIVGI